MSIFVHESHLDITYPPERGSRKAATNLFARHAFNRSVTVQSPTLPYNQVTVVKSIVLHRMNGTRVFKRLHNSDLEFVR
jgi:hypothetical protein